MRAIEQQVLGHVARWLRQGKQVWLCTIVVTLGSSPRPVGSLLACNETGEQSGSLSGGCVEDDLLERIRNGELAGDAPQLIEYGVTAEENERLGLPCGGRLHVLVQSLSDTQVECRWVDAILQAISQRQCIRRSLDLNTGVTTLTAEHRFGKLSLSEQELQQSFGPQMRMLLVGAGQLSQSLTELATAMDYDVLVTDPRQQMLDQWEGPDVPLLSGMPDDVVRAEASDPHSIIITLTHDPRIDDMALTEALESEAWYIGALGSTRTTAKRLERLRILEISEENIARLHAPVGLSIGSKTPLEIAIAIMAQITQLRRTSERLISGPG